MKASTVGPYLVVLIGALYFLLPLVATFEFSLSMLRGIWSFEAYRVVFADPRFRETFLFSIVAASATIVLGALLVVPTAYWVRLKFPKLRPVVEFITLLPLVIPPIVLVFGYLRLYNSSSFLPFTGSANGTNLLLVFGYVVLSLPYMFRAVDTGMAAIDIRTLTEAAESLGAKRSTILFKIILPNVRAAVLSGAFLTFAIVIGEFVLASLLNRPAFGPYLALVGANRAYEPAALAVIAFAITWACMALIQLSGRKATGGRRLPRSLFTLSRRAAR
ncbi:MAG: ABC transporter permease [Aurantimonas endophytica]|uniref:Putative spermidine/putrescine transport system permease protein n=1 Tax=Aurantimonas endophytica TaxID=1522175 RepID=A0A7W6HGH9_9HYPH|nr:ABC transporter permease [Aurantimonas endophytica]MBB4004513.1 putative spermidine/putrescine transport system permease protein [Aurantimonas endophytica]MCO6405349.1 ABC transporter permease subunit [Aurantimonas endophytica]